MATLYDADGNPIGDTSSYDSTDPATIGALSQTPTDPVDTTTTLSPNWLSEMGLDSPSVSPNTQQQASQAPATRSLGPLSSSQAPSSPPQIPQPEQGVFTKLLQGVGIANKQGNVDYSDPKVLAKIFSAVNSVGGVANALMNKGQAQGYKSPDQLKAALSSPFNNWNPTQQAAASAYFNSSPSAYHSMKSVNGQNVKQAGKKYAEGGDVSGTPMVGGRTPHSTLIEGPGGGQDDLVPAALSPSEYVFDAETVSMLGDGDPKRGAEILDKWREQIRKHKRAAKPSDIAPKAKTPESYLQKVKA